MGDVPVKYLYRQCFRCLVNLMASSGSIFLSPLFQTGRDVPEHTVSSGAKRFELGNKLEDYRSDIFIACNQEVTHRAKFIKLDHCWCESESLCHQE